MSLVIHVVSHSFYPHCRLRIPLLRFSFFLPWYSKAVRRGDTSYETPMAILAYNNYSVATQQLVANQCTTCSTCWQHSKNDMFQIIWGMSNALRINGEFEITCSWHFYLQLKFWRDWAFAKWHWLHSFTHYAEIHFFQELHWRLCRQKCTHTTWNYLHLSSSRML